MLLTRCNPLEAEKLRKLIAGEREPAKGKPKAPKRTSKRAVQLVEKVLRFDEAGDTLILQLPLYLGREMYNTGGAPGWLKSKTARKHIDLTLEALRDKLPTYSRDAECRAGIRGVTFVRLSPSTLDDDNVPAAFKHVRDATFAWLVHGDNDFNRKAIGHYDATVKQGKHTCQYEQSKHDAHGIQIRLHL